MLQPEKRDKVYQKSLKSRDVRWGVLFLFFLPFQIILTVIPSSLKINLLLFSGQVEYMKLQICTGGSVINCSYRGYWFSSQHLQGCPHPLGSPVSRNVMPYPDINAHCTQ